MLIGSATREITFTSRGIGMMGWGMLENVVQGHKTPLHARAFVLREGDQALAMVCCELAFISLAVKEGVCRRLRTHHADLGLDLDNVMLMATHTHSGPGGYTHYPFYNITIPGFVEEVYEAVVGAIVSSIAAAADNAAPGRVRFGTGEFAPEIPVAFNRSIEAYNLNPEVTPVGPDERHLALDRAMRLLRFDREDGTPIGAINWFAVHCTSVHSDNVHVHFDNKGYGAQILEGRYDEDFVGAFAQGAAGDVTPNYKRHRGLKWVRGEHADDDRSARHSGELQAAQAERIMSRLADADAMPERLASAHRYVDMANVEVDPRFAKPGCRTGAAEIGLSMFFGTEEGPGLPRAFLFSQGVAARLRPAVRRLLRLNGADDAIQGEKITVLESGRRRLLGMRNLRRLPLPWGLHPSFRLVRELDVSDMSDPKPWTPHILPLQLFVIGSVAIAAVAHEFTTVAGQRLRAGIAEALRPMGVEEVVLSGYSNAYAGYVTTPQEYALQDYEGASTHFGKWTLPAYQTKFDELAAGFQSDARDPGGPRPPEFTARDLATRSFG